MEKERYNHYTSAAGLVSDLLKKTAEDMKRLGLRCLGFAEPASVIRYVFSDWGFEGVTERLVEGVILNEEDEIILCTDHYKGLPYRPNPCKTGTDISVLKQYEDTDSAIYADSEDLEVLTLLNLTENIMQELQNHE